MTLSVGLLHYTAPPVVGGVEAVLGQHARLLAGAGHRVRVIAGSGGARSRAGSGSRAGSRTVAGSHPGSGSIAFERVPLIDTRHPAIRRLNAGLRAGSVPAGFEGIVDELAAELSRATADLDVLVAHNVTTMPQNLALTAALHRLVVGREGRLGDGGPRLVAWAHDVAWASARIRPRLHDGRPWSLLRDRWPGVVHVTISQARRAELAAATGLDGESIEVVPNGVDIDMFRGVGAVTRGLVRDLGLTTAAPILLTPARVTPRKNLELAIGVARALRRDGADARLIVTGAPDPHDPGSLQYLARLRELAAAASLPGPGGPGGPGGSDGAAAVGAGGPAGVSSGFPAVHLLADGPRAWRSDRVVRELYRVADALFLPSFDEGFGLPILEAAAARLPVVCADIPAFRELAGPDATYVDPAGDPARVAEQVSEALAADHACRLSIRARREFSWDALFATRIEPLLHAAAGTIAGGGEW